VGRRSGAARSGTPPVNQPPQVQNVRVKPRWWVARGESVVASLGIVLGVVIVGVLAASSWWTLRTYRASLERGREEQLRTAAPYMADHIMDLLNDGKAQTVTSVLEAARQRDELETCRVLLADGKTLGEAKGVKAAPKIVITPSQKGEDGAPGRVTLEREGDQLKVTAVFTAKPYGKCVLEMTAVVHYPVLADKDVQLGIGATGLLGMSGLLLTYKLMRRRLRGLAAIAEALRVVPRIDARADTRALRVSESFGPEARAWNMLLEQRDAMRERAMLEGAAEKLQSRGGGGAGGDLGAACDALWTGLVILDGAGKVRYANGAAGVLLRRKREELSGATVASVIEDKGAAEAILAVASGKTRQRASIEIKVGGKAEGGKEGAEMRVGSSDSTTLKLTARPLRREDGAAGDGPSAIVLIEDVTQSRVADESRNAFVAQATHELRTPLTNIRLYVETMVDEGENDAAVRSKCINVISGEVKRLERIVSDMLSVAEIEAGSLKLNNGEIRLDALFEELEADFRAQAEDKEIKLVFDLPPKYPLMQGDRDKLLLALNNLIGNALKYTPAGGAVTVKVMASAERELVVDVTDNGIGISGEEQELIFDRFYRAKDRRIAGITGSGIGLALARQVVRLHHGEITVKSQLDKGSTFTLTVPLGTGSGAGKTQAMAA
jgi:signal transduction histidine kinase